MSSRGTSIEDEIKARARELGFDLVGIAAADPFPGEEIAYSRWVGEGMHAGMSYMEDRAGRVGDPRRVHPDARSIVAVALNYYAGEPAPVGGGRDARRAGRTARDRPARDGPQTTGDCLALYAGRPEGDLRGLVARYAWGDDYHAVVEERLRVLSRFLRSKGAGLSRLYADTGPLPDRAVAQRAGLGWRGRHSCLITERFGTWVVLGEILTDLPLAPDEPALGDCGSCEACMSGSRACPTGAIVAPGVVDARRCISYWTIEHRGWIPREVRPTLGAMVFGCDLCQEACPFNRAASPTAHPEFLPGGAVTRPGGGGAMRFDAGQVDRANPDLRLLLHMTEHMFAETYRHSALRRAKRSGLRRNAAVALGNSGDPRAVQDLAAALADPEDSLVRGHAAWALGRIGGAQARAALTDALAREQEPLVRSEIEAALG